MYAEHFHENEWTELHTEAEADRLRELVDDCLTDPAHVRYAPPPTVSEATAAAYMEAPDPEPWQIGDNVIFGSAAWFGDLPEVSF